MADALLGKLESGCAVYDLGGDEGDRVTVDDENYEDLKHENETMADYQEASWQWSQERSYASPCRDNITGEIPPRPCPASTEGRDGLHA